ncbi:MAG: YggT family protein [PVC group bacterium]
MGIIGLLFSIYFLLLLVRAIIPDTGQISFNRPYRLIVRLTEPVITVLARIFPGRSRRPAPVLGMLLLVLLNGVLYSGDTGRESGFFSCGISRWAFVTTAPFWGVGKSFAHYFILIYRFLALLLAVTLLSPLTSASDQVSRLVKSLLQPVLNSPWRRWTAAAAIPVIVTSMIILLRELYQAVGWLEGEGINPAGAFLDSLALLVQLFTVVVYLLIFRAVISWFPAIRGAGGPLSWLEFFTEPFLRPFRRLGLSPGSIDLTPLAAIFVIIIGQKILLSILGEIYTALPGV